jgi:hypothetical protein
MAKKLWSLSGIAAETGRNFRTVAKALANIKPDGQIAGKPAYFLTTGIAALDQLECETGRLQHRRAPERYDPIVEGWVTAIETTGATIGSFLAKLRAEPSAARRRAMVEGGAGRCVGAHERALEVTVEGPNAFLRRLFVDSQMDIVTSEILRLCEWQLDEQPEAQ